MNFDKDIPGHTLEFHWQFWGKNFHFVQSVQPGKFSHRIANPIQVYDKEVILIEKTNNYFSKFCILIHFCKPYDTLGIGILSENWCVCYYGLSAGIETGIPIHKGCLTRATFEENSLPQILYLHKKWNECTPDTWLFNCFCESNFCLQNPHCLHEW